MDLLRRERAGLIGLVPGVWGVVLGVGRLKVMGLCSKCGWGSDRFNEGAGIIQEEVRYFDSLPVLARLTLCVSKGSRQSSYKGAL